MASPSPPRKNKRKQPTDPALAPLDGARPPGSPSPGGAAVALTSMSKGSEILAADPTNLSLVEDADRSSRALIKALGVERYTAIKRLTLETSRHTVQPIQEKAWLTILADHLPPDEELRKHNPELSRTSIIKMLYNQLAAQRSTHKRTIMMLLHADRASVGPILFGPNADLKQRIYFALAARLLEPRWVQPTEQEAQRVSTWVDAWMKSTRPPNYDLTEDKEASLSKYIHRSWQKAAQLWGPDAFPLPKGKEGEPKRRLSKGDEASPPPI